MVNGEGKKGNNKGGLAVMLLGKRRSAAEANEKIARVSHDLQHSNSGNNSGAEVKYLKYLF